MNYPIFRRPRGFVNIVFFEQECVRVPGEKFATLLDVQRGKALLLLEKEFRSDGEPGLIECELDEIEKMYP
jgi:hypothetical protein